MNAGVLRDFLIKEKQNLSKLWLPEGKFPTTVPANKEERNKLFRLETIHSDEPFQQYLSEEMISSFNEYLLDESTKQLEEEATKQIKAAEKKAKKLNITPEKALDTYPNKTRKVYFFPNKEFKQLLDNCFGWTRWVYNEAVTVINKWFNLLDSSKVPIKLKELRRKAISDNIHIPSAQNKEYLNISSNHFENNYNLLQPSVDQAYTAYKNILKLNKTREKNLISSLGFKKKKQMNKETITFIHRNKDNKSGIFFLLFQGIKNSVKDSSVFDNIEHDFTITKTKSGKYYVCIPYHDYDFKMTEKQSHSNIVSIDPGVRTPFTCYSPSGVATKIADDKVKALFRIMMRRDRAIKKRNKLEKKKVVPYSSCKTEEQKKQNRKICKKIRRTTRTIFKLQERLDNLRKEFHYLAIKHLTDNYEVILIPKFGAVNMVRKEGRKISKKTVREMGAWGHYNFRTRLIQKAKEKDCLVVLVEESYTTKTCGNCGTLNNVGSSEVHDCINCKMTTDRDVNASRNIFIKYLGRSMGYLPTHLTGETSSA